MKKLLLSLMVLATLASCGKDNKVSTGAAATTPVVTNPISVNDPVAVQLGSYIDSYTTSFGNGTTAGYLTWNQILAGTYYQPAKNLEYQYVKVTASTASTNCEQKEGWLGIKYTVCKTGSSSGSTPTITRSVLHNSVDVEAKKAELRGIINSSTAGSIILSNSIYYVKNASTGVIYSIDLRLPLQANPSAIQQANNGEVEYFYGAK